MDIKKLKDILRRFDEGNFSLDETVILIKSLETTNAIGTHKIECPNMPQRIISINNTQGE